MDKFFLNSRVVDPSEVVATGSFTTLPVRINLRDDLANAATHKLLADWRNQMSDDCAKESHSSLCELGNWCSLVFPESLPDRIGILTYLTDLGLIHDDTSEDMMYDEAVREHNDLGEALNTRDTRKLTSGSRSERLKKLVANFLLEATNVDRAKGLAMVESYRNKWLAIMEHKNTEEFQSLDSYLLFRRENGGMDPFWSMVRFGMNLDLSQHELNSVEHIFDSADNALVLTNDYYSWGREYAASQKIGAGRIVNSVELMMRTKGLSVGDARMTIKDRILAYEKEFIERKMEFYDQNNKVSTNLVRWIEVAGTIIGGNHYWCTRCPRHHSWQRESDTSKTSTAEVPMSYSNTSKSTLSEKLPIDEVGVPSARKSEVLPDLETQLVGHTLWRKPDDAALLAPCDYISSMPSKGVRSTLIDALNDWLRISRDSQDVIRDVVQLLHDASLILDDIEDNSPIRRGKPAVHTIFGHSQAINSANYMFVRAVQHVQKLHNPHALNLLLEELENLYLGQSLDLSWKFELRCPTQDEYLNMIDNKTGGMFRLLLRLMLGECQRHMSVSFDRLSLLFGRYFQIRDDYMNLESSLYSSQKGACEDLDEGKFSFPIVCCLQKDLRYRSHILGIFRSRPAGVDGTAQALSAESKQHILECLRSSGALKMTREYANGLEAELEAEIERLEDLCQEANPMLRLLLRSLSMEDSCV